MLLGLGPLLGIVFFIFIASEELARSLGFETYLRAIASLFFSGIIGLTLDHSLYNKLGPIDLAVYALLGEPPRSLFFGRPFPVTAWIGRRGVPALFVSFTYAVALDAALVHAPEWTSAWLAFCQPVVDTMAAVVPPLRSSLLWLEQFGPNLDVAAALNAYAFAWLIGAILLALLVVRFTENLELLPAEIRPVVPMSPRAAAIWLATLPSIGTIMFWLMIYVLAPGRMGFAYLTAVLIPLNISATYFAGLVIGLSIRLARGKVVLQPGNGTAKRMEDPAYLVFVIILGLLALALLNLFA